MNVWIMVSAFCLIDYSKATLTTKPLACATIVVNNSKYKTENACEKDLVKGSSAKCVKAPIMNK